MEPIPETLEAIDELDLFFNGDDDLLAQLTDRAERVRSIAPACVGVSVASLDMGVTFTLVATSEEIADLDAVQYLHGGPCEEAVATHQGLATQLDNPLTESTWHDFSRAGAAAGIRSTVTFPIMKSGRAIGSVNLYGRSDDAFTGKHEELAAVFRAWAPGAVTNADLAFSTRDVAEQAPEILLDETQVAVATGILAASRGEDVDSARHLLEETAQRAGISLVRLADIVISLRGR